MSFNLQFCRIFRNSYRSAVDNFLLLLIMSFQSIWKFISYWYFRYLMVTELYMVERWERNVINLTALLLFCLVWYFNATYLISGMSEARLFVTNAVS